MSRFRNLLVLFLITSLMLFPSIIEASPIISSSQPSANGGELVLPKASQNDYVTGLTITPNPVEHNGKITVNLTFSDGSPEEHVFHGGDTITVSWPTSGDAYFIGYSENIPLYSADGTCYGTAVVTASGMTITFNSNVDDMYDVSGNVWFEAMAKNDTQTTEENTSTGTIISGSKTVDVGIHKGADSGTIGEPGTVPDFRKQAEWEDGTCAWTYNEELEAWVCALNPADPSYTQWTLTANENENTIHSDVTIQDTIGQGQELDPEWMKIYTNGGSGANHNVTKEGTVSEVVEWFNTTFPKSSLEMKSDGSIDWVIDQENATGCAWYLVYRCVITDYSLEILENSAHISWLDENDTTYTSDDISYFYNVNAGGDVNGLPRGVIQVTKGIKGTEFYENNELVSVFTVSGVEFIVEIQENGSWVEVGRMTSNAKGIGILSRLKTGHYRIYENEETLPDHLTAVLTQDNVYEFDLRNEETTDSGVDIGYVLNEIETTEIEVTKEWKNADQSENTDEHPTIYFQLYRTFINTSGNSATVPVGDPKPLADGETTVSWNDLPSYDILGNSYVYTVKEVDEDGEEAAPDGYTSSSTDFTFTNTKNEDEERVDSEVEITKVDENSEELSGATFTLYSGETVVATYTENPFTISTEDDALADYLPEVGVNDGKATLTLKETEAPAGYKLSDTEYTVEISVEEKEELDTDANKYITTTTYTITINGEESLTIDNEKDTDAAREDDEVEITKVDENSDELSGATFTLYDSDGNEITTYSDANYTISTEDDDLADYLPEVGVDEGKTKLTLKETEAPAGYKLSDTEYTVEISVEEKEELDTDANKYITTTTYTITINGEEELTIDNEKDTDAVREDDDVEITKVDENSDELSGATFTLYDSDGNEITTYSDANFTISTEDDALADYLPEVGVNEGKTTLILRETAAPAGYKLSDTEYTVEISVEEKEELDTDANKYITTTTYTITIDGKEELTIENEKNDTSREDSEITVIKVDESGESLSGATFTLYDSDGNEITTYSGADFTINTADAALADYLPAVGEEVELTLKETTAPSGYEGSDTEYSVIISAEEKEEDSVTVTVYSITIDGGTELTVTNTKKPEETPEVPVTPVVPHLPETGFSSSVPKKLAEQPMALRYNRTGMRLEIPTLSMMVDIVDIPMDNGSYPVAWLGSDAGLIADGQLASAGNLVITGHNHLNTTEAGPFAFIYTLREGDRIYLVDSRNQMKIYAVYANARISETDFAGLADLANAYDGSITLMTCENERASGGYTSRRVIAARPLD